MSTSIIVVPCFNEVERLDVAAFRQFVCANAEVRFLFVDDGSTDRTLDVLGELHRADPERLLLHALPRNVGKAEAVRNGLLAACSMGPRYVGFWDADLATPLEDIPVFAKLLDERPDTEMVFGSRVNLLGRNVHRNLGRHYVGRAFATVAAFALGVGIYDTQCGAKLFRVSDGFIGRLQEPFIGSWIFDVEILAREVQARKHGNLPSLRTIVYEHPLMEWRDVAGSKLRLGDWFAVGGSLVRIYWKYLRPSRAAAQERLTSGR